MGALEAVMGTSVVHNTVSSEWKNAGSDETIVLANFALGLRNKSDVHVAPRVKPGRNIVELELICLLDYFNGLTLRQK